MSIRKCLINTGLSILVLTSPFVNAVDRPFQNHLSIDDLKNISESSLRQDKYAPFSDSSSPFDSDHRTEAVREAAMVVGAQHGYISRMNKWKAMLKSMEHDLDALWDFATLMRLSNGNQNGRYLIPPIVQEVKDVKTVSENGRLIKKTDTIHRIIRAERLSLAPINWRSYLLYDDPINAALPPSDLFPDEDSPMEQKVWNEAINEGWVRGARHAEKEMSYRMMRMGQDFSGMAGYARKVLSGKMTETVVTYSRESVIGGGSELREGEEIYRIAVPAQFNGNPGDWKPMILSARDSLTFPLEDGSYTDPLERP